MCVAVCVTLCVPIRVCMYVRMCGSTCKAEGSGSMVYCQYIATKVSAHNVN